MDEHVLATINVGLHQQSEIRHQRHPSIRGPHQPLQIRVPALHLDEEQAARGEIFLEIQCREHLLPGMSGIHVDDARGQHGQVVGVEQIAAEVRVTDISVGLACQVVERGGQELLYLYLDRLHAAGGQREQPVAGERQQGAVLGDLRLTRVVWRAHDLVVVGPQHEATLGSEARADMEVDVASHRRVEGDALQRGGVTLRGIHGQRQRFGRGQHRRRHLPR